MMERQISKNERKRDKQPISVPFIWEIRPGTPKKDWKPTPPSIEPPAPPFVKQIVSVPFGWEEKPGTPFPSFTTPAIESPKQTQSIITFSSSVTYSDHEDGYWSAGEDAIDGFSDSEPELWSNETASCRLANSLISTTALSSAVPLQETCLALVPVNYGQLQNPGSPNSETDSTDSYARSTSLAGASFLEWLFPLLVPNSSSQERIGYLEKTPSHRADAKSTELLQVSNYSHVGRPLLTLGELIVMSRRRSYQRKNIKIHKQPSLDFMKRNVFGCGIFGRGNGMSRLHRKWKRQLQLKLI